MRRRFDSSWEARATGGWPAAVSWPRTLTTALSPTRVPLRATLLSLIVALAGCPRREAPGPRRPRPVASAGVLRVRLPADLPRLPCLMQGHTWCDRVLMDSVYEPLVRWSPQREGFEGVLATAWQRGEEGRIFRLTLRKDVRWHDGRPFGSADVKHSLERLRMVPVEMNHPAALRLMSRLERVSYRREGEVELRFTKPFGPVLEVLAAIPMMPAPPKVAPEAQPQPQPDSPPDEERVVGTGPYRFVQWWPAEKLVLGAWAGYWGTAPILGRIEFVVVPSLDGVVEQFRKGTLDLVLDLDTRSYRALLARLAQAAHPLTIEPAGFTQLAFNCRVAPFKDSRVRRALAMLIDRGKLVSGLAGPRPRLMEGPVWPQGPQRLAALGTGLPHDPVGAARLLREAGWALAGGRWQKDGQPLTLAVRTADRSEGINRGLRAIGDDLARAGITLKVEKRIWGGMVRELRHHQFDAALFATPLLGPWTDLGMMFSTASNHYGFSPPDLTEKLDRIVEDTLFTRRLARERRLMQSIVREVPFLVLHVPRSLGFSRRPLRIYKVTFNWFDLATLDIL